jgi:hypothetical protein
VAHDRAFSAKAQNGIDHEDATSTMTQRKKKATTGCCHCGLCGEKGRDAGGCPQRQLPPVDKGDFATSRRRRRRRRSQEESTTFTFPELFARVGGFRTAPEKL